MRLGIFADTHDHLTNIARAVDRFNAEDVDLVLFAGDLVSTIAVPPLRKLKAPVVGCFGDNEGNKVGLQSGFRLVGRLSHMRIQILPGKIELAEVRDVGINIVVYCLHAGAVIWVGRSYPRQLQIRVQPVQARLLLSCRHDSRRATGGRVELSKTWGSSKTRSDDPNPSIV
ncbi:MAG: metallophosphoesterase family protein [Pirellulales bacterium]|nr:metallophosphoesterase family protein [Pirellulales bacterium]